MDPTAPGTNTLAVWQRLMSAECDALRERAAACDAYSTADVAALRRVWDKDLVHAALALAKARVKARAKFGDAAAGIVADPEGVEMASSRAAASWKARRFEARGEGVVDLCCGIGGDAVELRNAGLGVLALDKDPVRAWMAGQNARCTSRCDTVEGMLAGDSGPSAGLFHADPSRRTADGSASKRVWSLADVQPPPTALREVIQRFPGGAIKLAPGVNYQELAAAGLEGEVEVISERGGLAQAVLWTGSLSRGASVRTATLLMCPAHEVARDGQASTISGEPDRADTVPVWAGADAPQFIHEVDDSVERAELLTMLCRAVGGAMLHPRLGLVAGERRLDHPMLTPFELLETAKWNEQRAAAALKRLGAGGVEVKTRAKAVNPDVLQPALTKAACVKGGVPLVLFVLRFGSEARMLTARRLGTPGVPR